MPTSLYGRTPSMASRSASTAPAPIPRTSRRLFVLAAVAGLLHAAPSLYWAAGGSALLETVGEFAVEMRATGGTTVALMLVGVGLAKLAGALVPLFDHASPPPHRWVRLASWTGAGLMLVWGGAGMLGAWVGLLTGATTWAHPAAMGHAMLWDPLFVLWGLLLAGALWTSRGATPRRHR